jgi:S-methylmethionine-dependent homocysteine/selenocysteine methylase
MELWSPIRAHAEWIVLLRESLYGHGPLTPAMASDEELCELGQWLTDREPFHGHLVEYQVVKQVHHEFHRRAAYCLQLANTGRRADAIAEAGENSELRRLSRQLVKTLQRLKRRVADIKSEGSAWGAQDRPG